MGGDSMTEIQPEQIPDDERDDGMQTPGNPFIHQEPEEGDAGVNDTGNEPWYDDGPEES
jgi:hypothetical protein